VGTRKRRRPLSAQVRRVSGEPPKPGWVLAAICQLFDYLVTGGILLSTTLGLGARPQVRGQT